MKVRELIEILEELDPEASVYLMSQQNWPFEVAIHGVTVREEFTESDDEDDDGGEAPAASEHRGARSMHRACAHDAPRGNASYAPPGYRVRPARDARVGGA